MVGVLIRMKLAVLRRAASGPRANNMASGAVLGAIGAAGTIAITRLDTAPDTVLDLLAVVLATWMLGWALAPAYAGQPALRAEQFALLPIPPRRLAFGLLATAFVGVPAAVTLLAFAAIVVYALPFGPAAVLLALLGTALLLTFVVLLSRLAAVALGALVRSRLGGAISGLITAGLLAVASSGWIVFVALESVLVTGFSAEFSAVVRALPSGWPLVAVRAADEGDWVMAVVPVLGLAVLVALLWLVWARALGPNRLARPVVRGSDAEHAVPRGPAGAVPAVFRKELRFYWRDPLRIQSLVVAPVFAVLTCLVPLFFGSTAFLPFLGALTALMGAVTSINWYGQEGTALWLTLVTPGSERPDVRGRQLAWLVWFAPAALLLTVAGTVLSGRPELWPWALTATVAVLGGAAGLLPWLSADQLVPGPDPRQHKDSPLDHGDLTGPAFVMMFLAIGTTGPALALPVLAEIMDRPALAWLGVPAGLLTGTLCYLLLGALAYRILANRGPELLYLLRRGREHQGQAGAEASALDTMPRSRRRLLLVSVMAGCIALFPQAVVPTLMKLSGEVAQVWFLALHLPQELQWPMIAVMYLIGFALLGLAWRLYANAQREFNRKRARKGAALPA